MPAKMEVVAVVPAAYAAASAPNMDFGFEPDQLVFRSDSGNFFFSFDGVTDHGQVRATDTYPLVIWSKQKKIWVRQSGGAAAARLAGYTRS